MFNLPNMITIIRFLLVPVFLLVFWSPLPYRISLGMGILAGAGLTDIIDGYVARRYNQITPLGKVLDPMADKLIILTVMTSLFLVGKFPFWLVGLILVKEIVLAFGGFILLFKEKTEVSASIYGKAATFSVYLAIFSAAFELTGSTVTAVIAGLLSILALINYITGFLRRQSC